MVRRWQTNIGKLKTSRAAPKRATPCRARLHGRRAAGPQSRRWPPSACPTTLRAAPSGSPRSRCRRSCRNSLRPPRASSSLSASPRAPRAGSRGRGRRCRSGFPLPLLPLLSLLLLRLLPPLPGGSAVSSRRRWPRSLESALFLLKSKNQVILVFFPISFLKICISKEENIFFPPLASFLALCNPRV